jgi:hypothetical protein
MAAEAPELIPGAGSKTRRRPAPPERRAVAGKVHDRHIGAVDAVRAVRKPADHALQALEVEVLAVEHVEAEPCERVAHAAGVADRVVELRNVSMAVCAVADDERDALLRMRRGKGAKERQTCGGDDVEKTHPPRSPPAASRIAVRQEARIP